MKINLRKMGKGRVSKSCVCVSVNTPDRTDSRNSGPTQRAVTRARPSPRGMKARVPRLAKPHWTEVSRREDPRRLARTPLALYPPTPPPPTYPQGMLVDADRVVVQKQSSVFNSESFLFSGSERRESPYVVADKQKRENGCLKDDRTVWRAWKRFACGGVCVCVCACVCVCVHA